MSTTTLDRNRPYGEVHGENTNGAFFDQDGFLFDNDGNLLEHLLDDAGRARLHGIKAKEEAQARAKEAYEASLRAAGLDPASQPTMDAEGEVAPAPAKVDLHAWATGQAKYQFFAVKDAMKDQYGFSPTNRDAAIKFLIDELKLDVAV
jgi:hypothetical protein